MECSSVVDVWSVVWRGGCVECGMMSLIWCVEWCGGCVSIVWYGCVECGMVWWMCGVVVDVWSVVWCACVHVWMSVVVWCVFPVCVVVDVCTHTWVVCVHIHNGRRLTLSDSIIESAFM